MVQWMGWATYVVCNKVRLTDILITLAAWATRFADYWMRTESFQSLSQPHGQPCSQPHRRPHSQPRIHPLASLPSISLTSIHQPCCISTPSLLWVSQPHTLASSYSPSLATTQPANFASTPTILLVSQPLNLASSQLNCSLANLRVVSLTFSQPIFQPASLLHISREIWDCTYLTLWVLVQCALLHPAHTACVSWWEYVDYILSL